MNTVSRKTIKIEIVKNYYKLEEKSESLKNDLRIKLPNQICTPNKSIFFIKCRRYKSKFVKIYFSLVLKIYASLSLLRKKIYDSLNGQKAKQ